MEVDTGRIAITENTLYENGFELKGFEYFVNRDTKIIVKLVTTKTGKHFFSNNTRGVKYMDQLFPPTEGLKIAVPEKYIPLLNEPETKVKAFKGDALINFFSRELLCKSTDVFFRSDEMKIANMLSSNIYLMEVCISIGIKPIIGNSAHSYGTAYEAKIYDVYCNEGFDTAFNYFKETVFEYYKNNGI